jgi:hypothetical protein
VFGNEYENGLELRVFNLFEMTHISHCNDCKVVR